MNLLTERQAASKFTYRRSPEKKYPDLPSFSFVSTNKSSSSVSMRPYRLGDDERDRSKYWEEDFEKLAASKLANGPLAIKTNRSLSMNRKSLLADQISKVSEEDNTDSQANIE